MDPTLQQQPNPQASMGQSGMDPAAQNSLMLQAIKAGAMGGANAPSAAPAVGQTPLPNATSMTPPMTPPTDPSSQAGGLGNQTVPQPATGMGSPMQAAAMQQMMGAPSGQGVNPVTQALFSPIPGGQ